MKIALDAMGHDEGPAPLIEGAALALREFPDITRLHLVGDTGRIEAELRRIGCNDGRIAITHSTQVVEMTDSAVDAVRKKKDSSIGRAVDLVKKGEADGFVSAGHTGAAVAASTIKLRTLPGIERPGIAATMPTETNLFVLIDAGANTDPTPIQMLHNAVMGSVYSRHVLGYENPRVGLMSIGTEDEKGNDFTRDSFELLKASGLNFHGNVEGHDLFENPVEVVVADGFTGNIVLKTSEAIAHAIFRWLKHELYRSPVYKLGALLARPAFRTIARKTSADEYGGMPLLGVNGVCIIAHGGSSPNAVKNAIRMARESINHQVNPHIVEGIKALAVQKATAAA
ncbi:MAG TPA: phosphate acyltransferase PlsX [Chthoniobacteraceae bacterium]|nr:phosphate acyltransferase PlsX [Chthoniobacteraceae bacterium]